MIEEHYKENETIEKHKKNLDGNESDRYDTVLTVAKGMGKGWYATILSNYLNVNADIPDYILGAVAFACREVINVPIKLKMINYSLNAYESSEEIKQFLKRYQQLKTVREEENFIKDFCKNFSLDIVTKFLKKVEIYDR